MALALPFVSIVFTPPKRSDSMDRIALEPNE
jgi:hypothetical protein